MYVANHGLLSGKKNKPSFKQQRRGGLPPDRQTGPLQQARLPVDSVTTTPYTAYGSIKESKNPESERVGGGGENMQKAGRWIGRGRWIQYYHLLTIMA